MRSFAFPFNLQFILYSQFVSSFFILNKVLRSTSSSSIVDSKAWLSLIASFSSNVFHMWNSTFWIICNDEENFYCLHHQNKKKQPKEEKKNCKTITLIVPRKKMGKRMKSAKWEERYKVNLWICNMHTLDAFIQPIFVVAVVLAYSLQHASHNGNYFIFLFVDFVFHYWIPSISNSI